MIKLFEGSIEDDYFFAVDIDARGFQKTAAVRDLPDEADEAIRELVRKPNHKYVLVSGIGDGETWGSNRNADYFANEALLGVQKKHEKINVEKGPRQRFRTFEDAHFFHHHKNKIEHDPHFGYVAKAIWNPKMRTVLMIVGVDSKKDPITAQEIEAGTIHSFSMGARLPYDRCSICNNKATKRSDYCDHLRLTPNKILDDGRKVFSYNDEPNFFDISKVTKPAFEAGRTLMKVAHQFGASDLSADLAFMYGMAEEIEESSTMQKISSITDRYPTHLIQGVERIAAVEREIPQGILDALLKENDSWQALWSAFVSTSIVPMPSEFAYLVLSRLGRNDVAAKYLGKNVFLSRESLDSVPVECLDILRIGSHNYQKGVPLHPMKEERSTSTLANRAYIVFKENLHGIGDRPTADLGPLLTTLYLEFRDRLAHVLLPLEKTAMNWNTAGKAALVGTGVLAPYVYSAHIQNKQMMGEPVGLMQRTLANNPGKLALAGGIIAASPKIVPEVIKAFRGRKQK